MAFYRKLATHTIYQIIARIVSSGISFLITVFIARHFGVSSYGDYAKVTAFISLFYLLADFGFNAVFLQQEENTERFKDLFYLRLILSVVLIAIVNTLSLLLPYNNITGIGFSPFVKLGIAIFSLTILTESILYSSFAIFQRKFIYTRFMWATILGSIATLGFVAIFSLLRLPFYWIFIGYVLGAILEAGTALFFTDEHLFPVVLHISFIQKLAKETLPVALMLVFNLIYFRIDMLLLSLFKPSLDVGLYDISYRVFDFLIALPLFLSNVLYPMLIDSEKNNRIEKSKVKEYVLSFVGLGVLTAIPFWFLSPIIFLLIRPQLLPAIVPLRILLLSLPIFFATNILQWLLLARKQQQYLAYVYFFLTIVNVVLNVLFIPTYGYVASAIITGIGEGIVLLLLLVKVFTLDKK